MCRISSSLFSLFEFFEFVSGRTYLLNMLCSQIGRYQHPFGSWPWPLYDVFVLWPLKSQQRFCTKVFGTAPGMDDMGCFERWMYRLVPSCSIPKPTLTAVCNCCGTSSSWSAMAQESKDLAVPVETLGAIGWFWFTQFDFHLFLRVSSFEGA